MIEQAIQPTDEQLRILRHMLGINKRAKCEPYRDYFSANAGDPRLAEMAKAGLVVLAIPARPGRDGEAYGNGEVYVTTRKGRELAIASQRAMVPNRGRQRYHDFLRARDVDPDLTFRDFLRRDSTAGSAPRSEVGP